MTYAWDNDYHNGVVCEVCGEAVCVHCNPDYMELDDCEEEHWSCSSCGKEVYRNTKYCDCGQMETWLLKDMGETVDKQIDVAVTLRARDYKGLDNYGSNGVIEWKY